MEPFIGQIMTVGFNFAPRGWAFCDGQLLPISQNQALFSILGTIYGGDGRTTFGLPELRGRVPIHSGKESGPGLIKRRLGERGGREDIPLTTAQMPNHTHTATLTSTSNTPITATATLHVKTGLGDSNDAKNNYLATGEAKNAKSTYPIINGYSTTSTSTMNSEAVKVKIAGGSIAGEVSVENTGNSQPMSMMQPFLALNYIIALKGIFPVRT
jgi:microcystin-dependent protein